jgi:cell division septal protein FtsQ
LRKVNRSSLVLAGIAALFAGLVYLFAWSSIFSVSSIAVTGAPTSDSQSAILTMANVLPGDKLARVEPRSIATRISAITWVKSVDISRNWINGHVDIAITARTPTAYFNGSTIDSTGTVFVLPGFAGGSLPTVSAANPAIGLAAINLFQTLPPSFKAEVTSLSARDTSNFLLHLTMDGRDLQIAWGKNEKTGLKIDVINSLLALPENKNIKKIDISAPHAPIVK